MTVIWLDDEEEQAWLARNTVAKYSPDQPRDDHGRWTAGLVLGQQLAGPGGSNPGGVFQGTDHVKRYVKFYGDEAQAYGEHLANAIYHDLGFEAPTSQVFESKGKASYASVLMAGKQELGKTGLSKERAEQILEGFAADVLTGNWDAVGLVHDNVLFPGAVRIDNGGAFLMRAQAGRKPTALLNKITEWEGFAPGGVNPAYAKVFKAAGLTSPSQIPTIKQQVQRILDLRFKGWGPYVDQHIPGLNATDRTAITDMLEARTRLLAAKVGITVAKDAGTTAHDLLALAKAFNPAQARVPAGNPQGGQWTKGAAGPSSAYPKAQEHAETLHRFSLDGGKTWTPERQALHDRIVAAFFAQHTPVASPTTVVFGGGPASGKSTVFVQQGNWPGYVHVDADIIKTMLPEFVEGVGAHKYDVGTEVHEESSYLSKRITALGTEQHYNLVLDGTGDNSYENLVKKVASYRADGRPVVGKYVTVDVETAIARAKARGDRDGRYVPETYMREMHRNVSVVIRRAIEEGLFDELEVFDTNGPDAKKLITARGKEVTIHDAEGWARFLAKAQTNDLMQKAQFVLGSSLPPAELHNYLAAYGQEWQAAPLPHGMKTGPAKQCYANATQAVIANPTWRFVEGVAFSKATGDLPFLHAWAVKPDGTVVDPTWPHPEHGRYFGVAYDRDSYLTHALRTGYYGVLGGETKAALEVLHNGGEALRTGRKKAAA